jgi:hypothetical protein
MKGIDLIKRMPLELQKEFASEFVKQKSKKKLVEYLNKSFGFRDYDFHEFINDAFIWDRTKGNHYYWMDIAMNNNYNSIFLSRKAQPTKTK